VRKRVGWLTVLFFAQLLTATVIDNYSERIQTLTALAIFIPLILSSGGNSGSQASTLVIRALTIDEVRLRDWWRVARRELATGLTMGVLLGALGLARVTFGALIGEPLNTDILRLAVTIAFSLVAVVLFGTLVGSMLPFALRRAGLDPASASGPLVSTLSDVTGLLIYFSIATLIIF
jgi:magnesium transporter